MAIFKNTIIDDTSHLILPNGTTAQRPSSPQAGYIRYNNSTLAIEGYFSSTGWSDIKKRANDGSSQSLAADSAQSIKLLTGTTTSGYYWIKVNEVATQIYCDMTGSDAWMLALRSAKTDYTVFNYNSNYWTNSTSLNSAGDPLTDINIKNNQVWLINFTTIRLTGSGMANAYTSNPISFSGFNTTLVNLFGGTANQPFPAAGLGRTGWINWSNAVSGTSTSYWDNQPNCNREGINVNGVYHYARIGITFNNEADCNTNDSGVGFGIVYAASGTTYAQTGAGSTTWSTTAAYPCHGWLWIK